MTLYDCDPHNEAVNRLIYYYSGEWRVMTHYSLQNGAKWIIWVDVGDFVIDYENIDSLKMW